MILVLLFMLDPLQPVVAFLYPLKASPKGFLMFAGSIEEQHRAVMG